MTLFDFIKERLDNQCYDENYQMVERNGRSYPQLLPPSNYDNERVQGKCVAYDEDVQAICNQFIFRGFSLANSDNDLELKKMILTRFLYRNMNYWNLFHFASKMVERLTVNQHWIELYFQHINDFMLSGGTSTSDVTSEDDGQLRGTYSSLPQNQVNLDVTNNDLAYADSNTINYTKDTGTQNTNSSKQDFNLETFQKAIHLMDNVLDDIEENCFLRVS